MSIRNPSYNCIVYYCVWHWPLANGSFIFIHHLSSFFRLSSDGLLLNDTLCVYGDLCLWSESFKNSSSVSRLSPDIVIPPCDLAADLKALWQDPEATHADIKLVTENKSFMAHK